MAMMPIIEGIDAHLKDVRTHIFHAEQEAQGQHRKDLRQMGDDIDVMMQLLQEKIGEAVQKMAEDEAGSLG
jgi:hypothetical protein